MLKPEIRALIEANIVGSPHGVFEGFRLDRIEPDRAVLRLPAAAHNMNGNGRVNGGATLALIDTAATCAAWASNGVAPGRTVGATVSVSTSFLAPGGASDLLAEARVIRRGGSLSTVAVSVADAEREIANALVVYKIGLGRNGGR